MRPRISRLKGMEDQVGQAVACRQDTAYGLLAFMTSQGYEEIVTPYLEEVELFLRKSGGELAFRLYNFQDPGGNWVGLRPEFTASVVRAFLEQGDDPPLPRRWCYQGPVFRYQPSELDGSCQFTQVGAELIGSRLPLADAEVLSLALGGLSRLGLTGLRLVLGHVGVASSLLEGLGLSEHAKAFLLGSLEPLARGEMGTADLRQRMEELGFWQEETAPLEGLEEARARTLLQGLLRDVGAQGIGSRSVEEVAGRFLEKYRNADRASNLEEGIRLVSQLSHIRGKPAPALRQARALVRGQEVPTQLLEELAQIVTLVTRTEPVDLEIDLGMAPGLAYYTGMVFALYHPSSPGEPLASGGRYDGLVKALGGGREIPALGFAYRLENVLKPLHAEGKAPVRKPSLCVLVAPQDARAWAAALQKARELQRQGMRVELEVTGRAKPEVLEYARRRGLASVLIVKGRGGAEELKV